MKTGKLTLAVMAGALVMVAQAHATFYDIGFTASDNSILADGVINVDGTGLATSGYITIDKGPVSGSYSLVPSTGGSPYSTAPVLGGQTIKYDDEILGLSTVPFLDQYGLLFSDGTSVLDIQFWGVNNGNNGYDTAVINTGGVVENVTGGMSLGLSPIPEPSSIIAGALMVLPFGASTLRILRRKRAV